MGIDIANIDSGNDINNGSVIIGQPFSPWYQLVDDENPAVHTPVIADLETKYQTRFTG